MTHPVYAAVAAARARFDTPAEDLAERVVENLRTVAESGDRNAAEVIARLEHLATRKIGAAYRAGVVVAEYLGLTDDYEVRAFAARYGVALIRARLLLKDRQPDSDGNGWAWSPDVEADVAQAVSLTNARARVIVLDPARQAVRRG